MFSYALDLFNSKSFQIKLKNIIFVFLSFWSSQRFFRFKQKHVNLHLKVSNFCFLWLLIVLTFFGKNKKEKKCYCAQITDLAGWRHWSATRFPRNEWHFPVKYFYVIHRWFLASLPHLSEKWWLVRISCKLSSISTNRFSSRVARFLLFSGD